MSSYNSYDGIPVISDHHLLTEILREEWGYEYYVMSDAGGTSRLSKDFFVCELEDHECIIKNVRIPKPLCLTPNANMGASLSFPVTMPRWVAATGASRRSPSSSRRAS